MLSARKAVIYAYFPDESTMEIAEDIATIYCEKTRICSKKIDSSILEWEQERDAYNALKPFNTTDELLSYDNGVKISRFIIDGETLSFNESDQIDALDKIHMVHESVVSIKYHYNMVSASLSKKNTRQTGIFKAVFFSGFRQFCDNGMVHICRRLKLV